MDKRRMPKILILSIFAFILCFGGQRAFAAESVLVKLPVVANGADCTAVLFGGSERRTLELKDGQVSSFEFVCRGIGNHDYVLELSDEDTDEVTFDKQVYRVRVNVYYDNDGKISYVISANNESIVLGDAALGKPDKLEFTNIRKGAPVPTKVCKADPPVKKVIRGGDPLKKSVFDFVMKPLNKDNPMPEGTENGIKTVHITGEGDNEFGYITFTKPGTYEYTAEEIDGGIEGYTYDRRIYTFRYVVTEEGENLICRTTVLVDGVEVDGVTVATFVNSYSYKTSGIGKKGGPKTGDDIMLIVLSVVVVAALIGLCVLGWFAFGGKKKKKKD